jgi:hypothetical protein
MTTPAQPMDQVRDSASPDTTHACHSAAAGAMPAQRPSLQPMQPELSCSQPASTESRCLGAAVTGRPVAAQASRAMRAL